MYVIEDILKTSTKNDKEVVMHISHMKYRSKVGGGFSVSHI